MQSHTVSREKFSEQTLRWFLKQISIVASLKNMKGLGPTYFKHCATWSSTASPVRGVCLWCCNYSAWQLDRGKPQSSEN
ncbi:hypothetical protein XELAEV_18029531mg [Xenopus laevis]|uniref:Uncharacterized protein n=1 Tax=Xenopus laevis TaxID=8355 RepID=A0A974CRH8_XENLA|nr:hypothetical protein XELAEV_18029531mg [Xenopus laevis]